MIVIIKTLQVILALAILILVHEFGHFIFAKAFGISKSTVHMDVAKRLERYDPQLYFEVKKVLEINKAERHIRGGLATKEKYLNQK